MSFHLLVCYNRRWSYRHTIIFEASPVEMDEHPQVRDSCSVHGDDVGKLPIDDVGLD